MSAGLSEAINDRAIANVDAFRTSFRDHGVNSTTLVGGCPDYWSTWIDTHGKLLATQLDGSKKPFWLVDEEEAAQDGLSMETYRPTGYQFHVVGRPCEARIILNYWRDSLRGDSPRFAIEMERLSSEQRAVLVKTQLVFEQVIDGLLSICHRARRTDDDIHAAWVRPFGDVNSYPSADFVS